MNLLMNEFYIKTNSQKDDINSKIAEIYSGKHNDNLDKIKEKLFEKFENFSESFKTLERLYIDYKVSEEEKYIWKK